jgi:hypothetical protein
VETGLEGSRFGTWPNHLTTFIPASDPQQIVATSGSRERPKARHRFVVWMNPSPTPDNKRHAGPFPGAACFSPVSARPAIE